ncbi:hypothetical protein HG434_000925 [Candidatus Saccharibacteria bacterium]|nr:hypothetical protein [Candidatus Saccharibacteria bacterium]
MCMPAVNPFSPGVPYHWKESYVDFDHPFAHPQDFAMFIVTPVRERDICLLDKTQAYIAEPHVIPLGQEPKFGLNLYALGIEVVILAGLILFAIIARRQAKRTEKSSTKHAWRGSSYLAFVLAALFVGCIIYYSLYRFGLVGSSI